MTHRFPDWLVPMAATLTQERFAGPDWLFERKFDGIRLLAFKNGAEVRLLSRNQLLQNASYPGVAAAIASLAPHDLILDGEATGVWGKQGRVAFHVFDLLWIDSRNLTGEPLHERQRLLRRIRFKAPMRRVTALDEPRPWERACREGWEGVIAKRRDAPYEHRRSPHWLKMKCEATQELVVGGFTDPQGGRVGLGALLVGYFDKGDLIFAGKVGTGFNTRLLRDLRARLDALAQPAPPFANTAGLPRLGAHWAHPEIVVQVAFTEWTVHGKLRHPRLLGVRVDKSAREVVRETP
jgi:bifunctional non-homologous end joining protein LigD